MSAPHISANVRPLPRSMSYYCSKLAGFRRQTVKVLPLGLNTAQAGGQIKFTLPSNSLLDLSSFSVYGNLTGLLTTDLLSVFVDTNLIKSVQVEVGGVTVSSISQYGHLMSVLKAWTHGYDARVRADALTCSYGMRYAVAGNNPVAIQGLLPLAWSPSTIDTGVVPEITVTLTLSENTAVAQKISSTTTSTYTFQDAYSTIDIISFVDDGYSRMLRDFLNNGGGVVEIPFPTAYHMTGSAASAGDNTVRMSVSSPSVDMLVGTAIPSDYTISQSLAYSSNTVNDNLYYWRKTGADVSKWQFFISGNGLPSFPVPTQYTPGHNAVALNQTYEVSAGHALNSPHPTSTWWACFNRLSATLGGEEISRYLSGMDTRQGNVELQFYCQTTAANRLLLFWAITTSVLRVGAGKQMELL